MRICLVTREYPALGSYGGIGTYTRNMAQGLAGRGHDVTVLARSAEAKSPFKEGDVTVVPVQCPERWRLPAGNGKLGMTMRALPFIAHAARTFRRLHQAQRFDVVEVPEYEGWGLAVAHASPCPVVVRLHSHSGLVRRLNQVLPNADSKTISELERRSVLRADAVLANSAALARAMASDFNYPLGLVDVLPLGIDTTRFTPGDGGDVRARLGISPTAPIILYVGRLERRKGVETLVEAFARIRGLHPEAVLLMAGFSTGTGPNQAELLPHLTKVAAELGCDQHVKFLGHVPYDELPQYYAACDVFAAPSLYEPFGMIYLEAMACGKPTIGCRSGGVPEIIRDGETGILVPPGEDVPLAAALDGLLSDPQRRARLGAAAREAVVAEFSLPVIAGRMEDHYRALLAGHSVRKRAALEDLSYARTP